MWEEKFPGPIKVWVVRYFVFRLFEQYNFVLYVRFCYQRYKVTYQAFFWVLIDLIMELLGLIIKPFDNQTKIWP